MSWQSQFDGNGPTWHDQAAAVAEEKRLQEMLDESKEKNLPKKLGTCDPYALKELDLEMHALYQQEKQLLEELGRCISSPERVRIEGRISSVRNAFSEVKAKYVQLRESEL